jgi:hypothetical protein
MQSLQLIGIRSPLKGKGPLHRCFGRVKLEAIGHCVVAPVDVGRHPASRNTANLDLEFKVTELVCVQVAIGLKV